MTQRKPKRLNPLGMNSDQREALAKYQQDFKAALPHMVEFAETAKRVHEGMINAPVWSIQENLKPDAPVQDPGMWSVGHAKINYVDKIETSEEETK